MQPCSTHSDAGAAGEIRLYGSSLADKPDAAERVRLIHVQPDAQPVQSAERIGHQTLAARFVDRRMRAISHRYVEAFETRGYRGREPRRPAAHHENIRL